MAMVISIASIPLAFTLDAIEIIIKRLLTNVYLIIIYIF